MPKFCSLTTVELEEIKHYLTYGELSSRISGSLPAIKEFKRRAEMFFITADDELVIAHAATGKPLKFFASDNYSQKLLALKNIHTLDHPGIEHFWIL